MVMGPAPTRLLASGEASNIALRWNGSIIAAVLRRPECGEETLAMRTAVLDSPNDARSGEASTTTVELIAAMPVPATLRRPVCPGEEALGVRTPQEVRPKDPRSGELPCVASKINAVLRRPSTGENGRGMLPAAVDPKEVRSGEASGTKRPTTVAVLYWPSCDTGSPTMEPVLWRALLVGDSLRTRAKNAAVLVLVTSGEGVMFPTVLVLRCEVSRAGVLFRPTTAGDSLLMRPIMVAWIWRNCSLQLCNFLSKNLAAPGLIPDCGVWFVVADTLSAPGVGCDCGVPCGAMRPPGNEWRPVLPSRCPGLSVDLMEEVLCLRPLLRMATSEMRPLPARGGGAGGDSRDNGVRVGWFRSYRLSFGVSLNVDIRLATRSDDIIRAALRSGETCGELMFSFSFEQGEPALSFSIGGV